MVGVVRGLTVGVIGAGRWGRNHIRTLFELGILGVVIDPSLDARLEIAREYPDVPVLADYTADLAVPAYVIATPAETHFRLAARLIQDRRHVLVEKPITLSAADALELVRLAKDNGVVLLTGHLLLFHGAFQAMRMAIQSEKLGKLQYLYSNRVNLGTVRTEENSLWSFAPHDIALFEYLIGHQPISVSSSGGAFLQPHIHDTTVTSLQYPGNVAGHIFVSWLHPFKEHRFVVVGSKGMMSYDDTSKSLVFYEKGIDFIDGTPVKREAQTIDVPFDKTSPLTLELLHFVDCIRNPDVESIISGEKGVSVLTVLETADLSLKIGIQKPPIAPTKPSCFVHDTAVIDERVHIGEGSKIWHFSHIQSDTQIGRQCILGQNVNVGNRVVIGNYVKIQNNVSVYEGVELEDYVFCGPSMVFTNINLPRSKYPQAGSEFYQRTRVREGASLGANSTIVCGVTIGRFAMVGAGAVVTKDVPDFGLVVGCPARLIDWVSEAGVRMTFDDTGQFVCPKSGVTYHLQNGQVFER